MAAGNDARREQILAAYRSGDWSQVEQLAAPLGDEPFALHLASDARLRLGKGEAALAGYERLIAAGDPPPPVLLARADALNLLGRKAEAADAYEAFLKTQPNTARAWRNLSGARAALGDEASALRALDRALSLKADYHEARLARAELLEQMGRLDAALRDLDHLHKIAPQDTGLRYRRAICALRAGRFDEGLPDLELRWALGGAGDPRRYPKPLWLGQTPLQGKRLVIHQEQGFGDLIQLARYAPMAAAAGARVHLQVRGPAKALLEGLDGVAGVHAVGDPLPEHDLQIPVFSLPLAFGTTLETIPAGVPYLTAPAERVARWRQLLGEKRGPRVGLAWAGNPEQANDANRSMPVETLLAALPEGPEYLSLQKDVGAPGGGTVRPLPAPIEDFADTAAIIGECDLVISVCSAPAHLAGAMGKPVWVMLCRLPDFRWMAERTDSPWYPTARLFRQPKAGDWQAVAGEVGAALRALS